jgi:hypothetical protein
MKQIKIITQRFLDIVASRSFFWCIVGILVVQAAWVALTSHYPMAFDEDFHLGIIRIYASHLNPFLSGQPANANAFGAVARDPSYLYQYLMSFPYRLITLFTHDQTIEVIILRFINIGLFCGGLILYRRLLTHLKAPNVVIHGSLFLFVLIPVVPLLAGQINYDNLFIPAVVLSLLLTVQFIEQLRARKFSIVRLVWLLVVCLLASIVKYAFLPVFFVIGLVILVELWRFKNKPTNNFWQQVRTNLKATGRLKLVSLALVVIIAAGLFSQRYVVNLIQYHAPIPDCSKVLSIQACSAYGPWIRDYNSSINKVDNARNAFIFTGDWFYGMWLRLYFAVDGPATGFQTRGPLPIPSISAIVISAAALLSLLAGFKKLIRRYDKTFVLLLPGTAAFYIATLWLDEHKAYERTGQPVAINGRYLLPFIPQLLVLGALAARELFKKYRQLGGVLVIIIFISQIWGGGVLTYILRSNDNWYWPNPAAKTVNHAVQKVLGPVTPGYSTPTEFLH